MDAAHRRIEEEMGFDCPLVPAFQFRYRAELDHGLTENEYDHVFFGIFGGTPHPNPLEVMDFRYVGIPDLKKEIAENPDHFTAWFKIILDKIEPYMESFNAHRGRRRRKGKSETPAA